MRVIGKLLTSNSGLETEDDDNNEEDDEEDEIATCVIPVSKFTPPICLSSKFKTGVEGDDVLPCQSGVTGLEDDIL